MELLLAEQTLLVALDDAKGTNTATWAGDGGLAAALLLDLGHRELLHVDADRRLVAVDGEVPGHELLAEAHAAVRASEKPRKADDWLVRLPGQLKPLRERLARGLVARGLLSEERSRLFGIFPQTRFPAADPGPERELRQRLTDVLVAGRAPTEEEALLIGLLAPLGLVDRVVAKDQRRAARQRAEQIGELGVTGPAVRDAVQALQAAVLTAAVIIPAVTGGSS